MFARIAGEERGIAMITAVLVSGVVLVLTTVVLQLSIHNTERSGEDRRRVQAIAAAEAGIDYYFSYLTQTGGQAIQCVIEKPMQGSPGSFRVQAFFYDNNGVALAPSCPPGPTTPGYVMLYSEGRSGTATPVRKMQAYARLTVTTGNTFDNAGVIFAQNSVNFTSNARIGGAQHNDADVYTNGNVSLSSNSTIFGRIYAQGTIAIGSNSEAKREVWARQAVNLQSRSSVRATATSSRSSITLANNSRVYGDAKAAGSITGGIVDGSRSPNQAGLPDPPTRTFPAFSFCEPKPPCTTTPADWTASGYTNQQTFTGSTACANAVNYIRNTWTSGNLLVRILAPGNTCTTTFVTNTTYNVRGNLAIISDGPITLLSNARLVPSPTTSQYNVFVFAGLSGTSPCNITANPNSGFNPGLATLLYVPATCTIDLLSNSTVAQGQMIGGTINFKHTVGFTYQALPVPGTGAGGFKQDVVYKREIAQL